MEPVVLAAEQREDERGVGEREVKDRDGESEEAAAAKDGRGGVSGDGWGVRPRVWGVWEVCVQLSS